MQEYDQVLHFSLSIFAHLPEGTGALLLNLLRCLSDWHREGAHLLRLGRAARHSHRSPLPLRRRRRILYLVARPIEQPWLTDASIAAHALGLNARRASEAERRRAVGGLDTNLSRRVNLGSSFLSALVGHLDTILASQWLRSSRPTDNRRLKRGGVTAPGELALRRSLVTLLLETLGHWRPLAEVLAVDVEDEDRDGKKDGDAGQDKGWDGKLPLGTSCDVRVEGCGVDGGDAGEEVTAETVAACGTGSVRTVSGDHVVNSSHVDRIVGDADHAREDFRSNPVYVRRTKRTPRIPEEADGFKEDQPDESLESALRLDRVEATALHLGSVAAVEWQEEAVRDDVAGEQREEAEADSDGTEVPLLENKAEAVEPSKDERIAEATEQGQVGDDRLDQQHTVGTPKEPAHLLEAKALPVSAVDLIRAVDVGILVLLTATLGFFVEHYRRAGLRDEQVGNLRNAAKDELHPERPAPVEVCAHRTAKDGSDNRASDRREHDVCTRVLLTLRLEHVSDHAKGDTAASR